MFSESESDVDSTEEVHQIAINEHYEKAFIARKEREELMRLKEKLGSDFEEGDEEDSESDESEDSVGEELTPATDVAILRTLAKIKRKDPSIYNKDAQIFEQEQSRQTTVQPKTKSDSKKSKPFKMKDMILDSLLNSDTRQSTPEHKPPLLTHNQEQAALRNETISAFHHAVSDDESDDLLVPREKTKDELELEEEEYAEFLKREVGEDLGELVEVASTEVIVQDDDAGPNSASGSTVKKEKKKKSKGSAASGSGKSKEEQDHEFLMNYILNRAWIDKTKRRVPTYGEVTSKPLPDEVDQEVLEEEEIFDEMAEDFEASYNFRFEEPEADTIARFPRNIPSAIRRTDTTRIDARQRRKERKEEEKLQRKEEVNRLKALKLKEQKEKLEKIGKKAALTLEMKVGFKASTRVAIAHSTRFSDLVGIDLDLDGDWDPEKHDQQMSTLYESGKVRDDEKKPKWDEDIDLGDIVPEVAESSRARKKKKRKEKEGVVVDGGVNVDMMDADLERDWDEEEWDGTEEMRKQKLDQYMEELYKMEFNDLVGTMPTRFNYVPVPAETYHLSAAEILAADDKDLNEYMGLKKFAPYRKEKKVKWDHQRNERLRELREKLKDKGRVWKQGHGSSVTASRFGSAEVGGDERKKKRMGKKERRKMRDGAKLLEGGEE